MILETVLMQHCLQTHKHCASTKLGCLQKHALTLREHQHSPEQQKALQA